MTIAQALKEKNKIGAKLSKHWTKLQSENSMIEGSTRSYDPLILLKEIDEMTQNLIELKTKIHTASSGVRSKIFRMSELKSYITHLKLVSTKDGYVKDRYDNSVINMEAVIKTIEIDALLEKKEAEIEKIQEELDIFNHQTSI